MHLAAPHSEPNEQSSILKGIDLISDLLRLAVPLWMVGGHRGLMLSIGMGTWRSPSTSGTASSHFAARRILHFMLSSVACMHVHTCVRCA
eukprot:4203364-Pleurochrysis_carterae.AAC.6